MLSDTGTKIRSKKKRSSKEQKSMSDSVCIGIKSIEKKEAMVSEEKMSTEKRKSKLKETTDVEKKKSRSNPSTVGKKEVDKKNVVTTEKKKSTAYTAVLGEIGVVKKSENKKVKEIEVVLNGESQLQTSPALKEEKKALKSEKGKSVKSSKRTLSTDNGPNTPEVLMFPATTVVSRKEKATSFARDKAMPIEVKKKTEMGLCHGKSEVVNSVVKRNLPLKISDGRIRSPFFSGSADTKETKTRKTGSSVNVDKGPLCVSYTANIDVTTDTDDLITSFGEMSISRLPFQIREVQDFLYRQYNCTSLKDVMERFQHFEKSIVRPLWESAECYEKEKRSRVTVGDVVFEVLDEEELLNAINSVDF